MAPAPSPTRTRANGRPESKSALILLILVIEFHTGTFYSHSRTAGCPATRKVEWTGERGITPVEGGSGELIFHQNNFLGDCFRFRTELNFSILEGQRKKYVSLRFVYQQINHVYIGFRVAEGL